MGMHIYKTGKDTLFAIILIRFFCTIRKDVRYFSVIYFQLHGEKLSGYPYLLALYYHIIILLECFVPAT